MISLSAMTFMRLVLLYSDAQVRLTGHSAKFAGRVEVFAHGVWGRVLHTKKLEWGQEEATVVCRQLGFPGAITPLLYSSFGQGSGPVQMWDVQCTGSEKTIQQCQYRDWVDSWVFYVNKLEVGVICKTHDFDPGVSEIPIRLQGSSVPNAGRVEVLYAGIWGAINSWSWNINDATVACRQLGYQAGAEAVVTNDIYGPVSGPVWISKFQCSWRDFQTGTNLMSCSHDGIGSNTAQRGPQYTAGVICKDGSSPSGMPVRLRGSSLPNIGRVEVKYAGKWGTIHAESWDINDATVVCRQLGYSTASLAGDSLFCSAAVPGWFTSFNCYGNESSLEQCSWKLINYPSYDYCASVVCKDSQDRLAVSGFEIKLRGSSVPYAGRVELRFKGIWGTIGYRERICELNCTYRELARVICRQMDFTDGILALGWSVFGPGTGPQWFENSDIQCLGNESNLLNCRHQHEPRLTRRYDHDLGVVCKPPDVSQTNARDFSVRLNGSNLPFLGTIEVMYQGVWGGVLGSGRVDINVGHVVCRQLGYPGADKMFQNAEFGPLWTGPLWIWSIQCIGNETEISQCGVTTWDKVPWHNYHNYSRFQRPEFAAGVLCREVHSSASKSLNVRLAGAPIENAGRVEAFYAGAWVGVHCDGWDINDGHVVCRQLGYPGAISSGTSNQFGVSTGTVLFKYVRCLGSETNFGECPKDVYGGHSSDWFTFNCRATVLCKLQYQPDFSSSSNCSQVRCVNSGTCIDSAVGAICNCTDGFTGLHCEIPINPCQNRPCPDNTSCYVNETHYYCVPNNIVTTNKNDNGTILNDDNGKSSTTAGNGIFHTPFIAVLSVSAAVIVLLIIAVGYLVFRNRKRSNNQPSNLRAVFSNVAFQGDLENNLDEENAIQPTDVDLGADTTQTQERQDTAQNQERQDPDAIYEEASRPLPPIPAPPNTTRQEGANTSAGAGRGYLTPVLVPRASEKHYMGLTQNNTASNVPLQAEAGTYSNSYMPLSSAGRPADASYSSLSASRLQTS